MNFIFFPKELISKWLICLKIISELIMFGILVVSGISVVIIGLLVASLIMAVVSVISVSKFIEVVSGFIYSQVVFLA